MFKTEIHHYLQELTNSTLVWFMKTVSMMGTETFFMLMLFIILFGISFRKGFLVLQVLLWTSLLTDFLKNYFELPRPMDIDPGLLDFGERYNNISLDFTHKLRQMHFFDTLPYEIVEQCRKTGISSGGFPSGHVSTVSGFWLALAVLSRKRWLWILAFLLILLTALSRMFLAHHFLADVAGGLVLGVLAVSLFPGLIVGKRLHSWYMEAEKWKLSLDFPSATQAVVLLVLPLAVSFVQEVGFQYTAPLVGINLGVLLASGKGILPAPGKWYRKILAVLFALACYFIFSFLFSLLPEIANEFPAVLLRIFKYFLVIYAAIKLNSWLIQRFPNH